MKPDISSCRLLTRLQYVTLKTLVGLRQQCRPKSGFCKGLSDRVLHCLPFHLHLLDFLYVYWERERVREREREREREILVILCTLRLCVMFRVCVSMPTCSYNEFDNRHGKWCRCIIPLRLLPFQLLPFCLLHFVYSHFVYSNFIYSNFVCSNFVYSNFVGSAKAWGLSLLTGAQTMLYLSQTIRILKRNYKLVVIVEGTGRFGFTMQ